jgi:translation initiation factor 2B subunit (eIF-2B alpha/beta/delta family)
VADKKVTIAGTLSIDASKATKALEEVSKRFKSFEKSSFGKQMDDMRKMIPLIKDIDKGFGKTMQTMAKDDARRRVAKLTEELKAQSDELKKIVKLQDDLNNKIRNAPKGSAARQDAIEKRNELSYTARAHMQGMEQKGNEREELKKSLSSDMLKKIATYTTAALAVAGGASSFFGQQEVKRLSYENQASSTGNRLASMAFGKNIDLGSLVAFGDAGSIHKAGKDALAGTVGNKLFAGAQAGLQGGMAGAQQGGGAGFATGAGGAIAGYIAQNAELAPGTKTHAAAMKSIESGANNSSIESALGKNSFGRELMNMKIDQAPMRVAAMQGMAGAGSMDKNYWKNYRKGVKYGVEMPEASAMMQMMGQSGAIGSSRGDITDMLRARNSGVAQPGEYASMVSGMAGVSGDGSKTASMVRKAMEEGVRIGVDRSLVKNLVRATTDIASTFNTEVSSTEGIVSIMDTLRTALGPKADLSKIGQHQLEAARKGMGIISEDSNTALGIGTGASVFQEEAAKMGAGQMSPAQMIALSKMQMGQKLEKGGPLYKSLLSGAFQGDEGKLDSFLAQKDNMLLARKARMDVGFSSDFEGLTTTEGIAQHQKDLKSKNKSVREAAEKRAQSIAVFQTAFGDEESATAEANLFGGQAAKAKGGKMKDDSGATGAGGLARYRAAIESLQQAAAGQAVVQEKMKIAMDAQLTFAKNISEKDIFKTMADGTTNIATGINDLKTVTEQILVKMGGKIPVYDRATIEHQQAKEKYQADQASIKADREQADKEIAQGNVWSGAYHNMKAAGRWLTSSDPDKITGARDAVNEMVVPTVKPDGKQ